MSEQIPQDPERQESGGVEGAVDDLGARETDADATDEESSPRDAQEPG